MTILQQKFDSREEWENMEEVNSNMEDTNNLVYLRAWYYDPELGRFLSLDPIEGSIEQAQSLNRHDYVQNNPVNSAVGEFGGLNRYAYAAGNPINLVDPSGMVAIDIWAAAFISPRMIRFPFGADPVAIWHGDDRSWHTLQDFDMPSPLSSRVWWNVHFDTSDLSTVSSKQDTGDSFVAYAGLGVNNIFVSHGKAPTPAPATVKRVNFFGDVEVEMEAGLSGKNPLSVLAPPIEMHYMMYFRENGVIDVYADIARFPWHEFQITVDGVLILQLQQDPLGPSYTPADLALPALNEVFSTYSSSLEHNFDTDNINSFSKENCLSIPYNRI